MSRSTNEGLHTRLFISPQRPKTLQIRNQAPVLLRAAGHAGEASFRAPSSAIDPRHMPQGELPSSAIDIIWVVCTPGGGHRPPNSPPASHLARSIAPTHLGASQPSVRDGRLQRPDLLRAEHERHGGIKHVEVLLEEEEAVASRVGLRSGWEWKSGGGR